MSEKYQNKKTTEKTETLPNQETKNSRKTISHYTILEKLGEGGMGVVYLAQQNTPIKRKVALKVIKPGMDTKEIIARFESERQALALMSHPHIAQVYDGGETDDAYPFFVMEYVPGLPITEYCDKFKLSIEERLTIFIKVCEAVQHAHYKGIVHRDLKPTNIICSFIDEKNVPKIIDFGISKALTGQGLTEKTVYTKIGIPIGTTLYMSPEQAELTGHDIDTRTDVYSLGMILYELLVGKIPYDFDELNKADFVEMLRVIKEKNPPKPSVKFNSLGDEKKTVSEKRKSSQTNISRILKGDLEKILMKALEKDKRYRYNSAIDLAIDLKRYLNKEPISARPPNFLYLLKKYLIRNKLKVSIFISVLLLIVVVSTLFFFFSKKVERSIKNTLYDQVLTVSPDKIKFLIKQDTIFENEFRINSVESSELKNIRIYHQENSINSEFGYPNWLSVEREYDSESKTLLFRYSINTSKSGEYKSRLFFDFYRKNTTKVDFDIKISERYDTSYNVLIIGPYILNQNYIDFLNTIDTRFSYIKGWREGLKLDEYSVIVTQAYISSDEFFKDDVNMIKDLIQYVKRGGNLFLGINNMISDRNHELVDELFNPLDVNIRDTINIWSEDRSIKPTGSSEIKIVLNGDEIEKCEITNDIDILRFESEYFITAIRIKENYNSRIILKNPLDPDSGFLILHEYGGKLIISTLRDLFFREPNRKLMENIFLLKRTKPKE